MRTFATALALIAVSGFAACGDDGDSSSTTDTSSPPADTSSPSDTAADTSSPSDTTPPADPCDPNPCTVGKAAECNADGQVVTYASPGTCTDSDGTAACEYAANEPTACADGEVCAAGACTSSPDTFTPGPASFIDSLSLAEGDCCFDFDDDSTNDNKFGTLLGTLLPLLGGDFDIDQSIADAIASGDVTVLIEAKNLSGDGDQTELEINGYLGDASTTHEVNLTGMGEFTVDPASFIPDTLIPLIKTTGEISGGTFTAGPANFILSIPLSEDLGGVDLNLTISETQLQSTVSVGANGTGLAHADGILGGLVKLADLAGALNSLGSACECMGLEGGPLFEALTEDKLACTSDFAAVQPGACGSDDGALCAGLGDNAGLVCSPAILGILGPDIDSDLNGVADSLSIGINYTGVSATITGLSASE